MILTVDNDENVKQEESVAFTIDGTVQLLDAYGVALKNRLTWYGIVAIV